MSRNQDNQVVVRRDRYEQVFELPLKTSRGI
jgi:hypothetical protein